MVHSDSLELQVGNEASFLHTITEKDVAQFAELSGDYNSLHTDEDFAKTTQFGKRVVHGMFLGALCSRLVGMYLPGGNCLYLKQTLTFKKPAFIGDTVLVSGEVTSKSTSTNIVALTITISKDGEDIMKGEAHVLLL